MNDKDLVEFFIYLRDYCYNRDFQIAPDRVVADFREHQFKRLHKPVVGGPASESALEGEQLGNEAGATKPVRLACEHPEEFIEDDVTMGVSIVVCKKCGEVF